MKVFENLQKYWNEQPQKTKRGLIAGAVGILVLTIFLSYWLLRTEYQVLFADLQPQDAASIVSQLERMKVPYKLGDGETKILVDKAKVHETRLKLMGKGVALNGNVGFEIFDKSDYGMTEYAQKINFQRALQGELARTIVSIKEIKFARVHLVLPETSIFKQNKSQPKASVSLILKDESRLTAEQIKGIQGLVAAAVPSLEPGEVTILDQRGVLLSSDSGKEGGTAGVSGQLAIKKEVESYLTRKAVDMLDRAFGPGQAIVSVDVTLNLDNIKSTIENVLPMASSGEGAVTRRRTTTQQAPAPEYKTNTEQSAAQQANARAQNTTSEVEYVLGRKIEQVVTTPGSIRRLSIGVLVPHDMDDARMANVRDIIAMAVGINTQRGDAIAVHSARQFKEMQGVGGMHPIPLEGEDADAAAVSTPKKNQAFAISLKDVGNYMITHPLKTGAMLLASILIMAILFNYLAGLRRTRETPKRHPELTPAQREALLAQVKQWMNVDTNKAVESGVKP